MRPTPRPETRARPRTDRSVTLLAALLLLVSACSSGNTATPTTDPDEDGGTTVSPAGGALPSSVPGVTDDTIKIGFAYLDLDAIADLIGFNHGPYRDHVRVLVDDLNAEGGINGRRVEVVPVGFDPVGDESQQATCIQLTEDEQVFAVLGTTRGDNVLCYTEQHDTIAVLEGQMTDERLERSSAPYATAGASIERTLAEMIELASAEGLLDGTRVAVHATEQPDHERATDLVVPALEAAGANVVYTSLVGVGGTDVGAGADEIALNVEAMRTAGVDTVFVVGESLLTGTTFAGEEFYPTLVLADGATAFALGKDNDLSAFDDVWTVSDELGNDALADPAFAECVAAWDAAHPDDPVLDPRDVAEGGNNNAIGLGNACRALTLFVEAATAAGTDLTNESFLAGLESLGSIHLPGWGSGSLDEDKHDALDALVLYRWDPSDPAAGDTGFAPQNG